MLKTLFGMMTGMLLTAGLAGAAPLTLDFNSPETGCGTGVTIANAIVVEDGHCKDRNIGDFQVLEPGDRLVIAALPGASFDYLGVNLLYYWDETFALPVADVPVGLDMTDPADVDEVSRDWLWQFAPNSLPLISVRGYKDGVLTGEWSDIFMDTDSYLASVGESTPENIDPDPRVFPGAPLFGIDRLEVEFAAQLENATVTIASAPVLIGDTWYIRLPHGSNLFLDDLQLNVAPVPLPLGGVLLFSGLGALVAVSRKRQIKGHLA